MSSNSRKRVIVETVVEILLGIKKMGIPFVILGLLFVIYSFIEGRPVIPFSNFMTLFITMVLFQVVLENIWLEREIHKLREEIKKDQL